jgi:ABC-type Mn2+/Zn2+ transport system permease subunit
MASVVHTLAHPWSEPIMRRAALECALLGISGGLLGCWLVLYGLSYSTESFAHGMLPGLVAAALLGASTVLGGAVGLAATAAAVALATRVPLVSRDAAIAASVTALLGLGVVLALSPASPPGIQGLLFGDILGVSDGDLFSAGVLAAALVALLPLLHGRLLAVGFDRATAPALGVRVWLVDAALLAALAGALLVAVQGLGNLLVVAVLIGPAATARLVTRRLPAMMALSVVVALVACVTGLYASYYASTAAGASIAAALVAVYALVRAGYDLA